MVFKKVYIPAEAIARKEDFQILYEDEEVFANVSSDWDSEHSRVMFSGITGGMIAKIKPDYRSNSYDIRVDQYTYTLHTHTIFKHYFFEGMLWQMHGSISNGHANFENEDTGKKDVLITLVQDWKGHGPSFEVKVKDLSKLRAAAAVVVALMTKEHYKGLSCGEPIIGKGKLAKKLKRNVLEPAYTYEQIQANPEITKG